MACVPSVARSLMPRCVAYYAMRWPNISLSINDIAASEVYGRSRSVNSIWSGEWRHQWRDLEIFSLMKDPFRLVCRRDDPWATRKSITWSQLGERPLLMLNNTSGSHQLIEATMTRGGTRANVFLELAQPSSVLAMVEAKLAWPSCLNWPRRDPMIRSDDPSS